MKNVYPIRLDVEPLENLSRSKAYRLCKKLNEGIALTQAEQNWVSKKSNNFCYRPYVAYKGYQFDFSKILRFYSVREPDGEVVVKYATNKEALASLYPNKELFEKSAIIESESV